VTTRAEAGNQAGSNVDPGGNGEAEPGLDAGISRENPIKPSFDLERLLGQLTGSDGRHHQND